jgi:hypothetical protein
MICKGYTQEKYKVMANKNKTGLIFIILLSMNYR